MKKIINTCIILFTGSLLCGQASHQPDSISRIQLCLLLDVSRSMDGLLSQAQNEIWKTISFLDRFEKDSLDTVIEIAVISYGNLAYAEQGHTRLISDFTSDIDELAKALVFIEAGGGNEFCGLAIQVAVDSLSWQGKSTFKCMIMAGNEAFDQGEVPYERSIGKATGQGIILNTIYCGQREIGIYENWQAPSQLGKGKFAHIDQDIDVDEFKTPYDYSLIQFYNDYRSTYLDQSVEQDNFIPFDAKGEVSPAFRDMIMYKFGRNKHARDLIDKFNDSNWELDEFSDEELPEHWRQLSKLQLKFKLLEYARKRNTYREGFETYRQKVEDFLRITIQPKLKDKTLNLALREMMSGQLIEFGFREKNDSGTQ